MVIRVFIFAAVLLFANTSRAQTPMAAPTASPSLEQRVADLEAYINNSARGSDSEKATSASNISGPGPGHNGWMMTASARSEERRVGKEGRAGGWQGYQNKKS